MADSTQTLHRVFALRPNRRQAAQAFAAAAGSLLVLGAAMRPSSPLALAQDGGDDDISGHGRGRGRGGDDDNNSGPGNADDPGTDEENAEDELVQVRGQVPEGAVEVRIVSEDAGGFVPGELTVDLGETVAFVNAHDDEHTATGAGFDTGVIDRGQVATVVFDEPGTFPYACQFHPVMTGAIRVRGKDGVVPQTRTASQEIPADATTVRIVNLAFDPAAVTIATGTAVTWINEDSVPHTVSSADGAFDSGILDPGANFTWTFDQPGSYPYLCQLHPQMQGTVIAQGEAVDGEAPAGGAGIETDQELQQTAATPAAAVDTAVSIVDFAFEPATIEVQSGSTVVWTNNGEAPHTVTGDFADSGILDPGQTFSHTFTGPGEHSYVCAIHPQMTGAIRISADGATASAPATSSGVVDTGLQGVWLMTLTPDSDEILGGHRALMTFHDDGTLEADFSAESGGAVATVVLTSGRGEWLLQDTVCRLSLIALMSDPDRRFAGTATVDAQGLFDAAGGIFDGTFDFAVEDASGQLLGDGSGTLRGGSVSLDP